MMIRARSWVNDNVGVVVTAVIFILGLAVTVGVYKSQAGETKRRIATLESEFRAYCKETAVVDNAQTSGIGLIKKDIGYLKQSNVRLEAQMSKIDNKLDKLLYRSRTIMDRGD